jgi:four helix bundle protein
LDIGNCKLKIFYFSIRNGGFMEEQRAKISERLLSFAVMVIILIRGFRKTPVDTHLARQVLRSDTSAGANYEEACSGESRADFTHKLQISLKELNETLFWLRLIERSQLRPDEKGCSQ